MSGRRLRGDLALAADVAFVGAGTEPHRKACLMIRQSLDADSAYVDAALHGDGLTSLQFREAKGAATHEVQANVVGPAAAAHREARASMCVMYLAAEGESRASRARRCASRSRSRSMSASASARTTRRDGEGGVLECGARPQPLAVSPGRRSCTARSRRRRSSSTDRRVVLRHDRRGSRRPTGCTTASTLDLQQRRPDLPHPRRRRRRREPIDTGFATRCNNDHGISPDGTLLAISDQSQGRRQSLIYTLPIAGGTPKLITPTGPSYWHGWSPDGKTLAFCGERDGEFDIYTIPAEGGAETRLTTAKGLDDGPEYSPDGKFIYFNSVRTGTMQIWRMKPDGSEQEPVTADEFNNWFPHLSPDGRSMVFLSYEKDVTGHPANKDVTLRMMTLDEQENRRAGPLLRRPGNDQRPVLVARRPEDRVRDLPVGAASGKL